MSQINAKTMGHVKKKENVGVTVVVVLITIYAFGVIVQQKFNWKITQIPRPKVFFQVSVQSHSSDFSPKTTSAPSIPDETEENASASLMKIVKEFIYPRYHPSPNLQNIYHTCINRHLNASCYDSSKNLWHPQHGSPLKLYTPQDFVQESQCSDISVLFIGDSRVRTLFATVASIYHTNTTKIHRVSEDFTDECINLVTPTFLKNAIKLEPHIKTLHKTMYTYRSKDEFRNLLVTLQNLNRKERISLLHNNDPLHHFHMEWDPLLTIKSKRLNQLVTNMDPGLCAVVVEGGLWHIMDKQRKFDTFRERLKSIGHTLIEIKNKRKANFKILFFLNDKPLVPKKYHLQDGDTNLLNNISRTVANELNSLNGQEEVIVWDSHLPLQSRFAKICSQHMDALEQLDGSTQLWRCKDPTHSGKIMFEHYGQMLVNYVCDAKHL